MPGFLALSATLSCYPTSTSCINVPGPLAQPSQWPHGELLISPVLCLHLSSLDFLGRKASSISPHPLSLQEDWIHTTWVT